MPAKQMESGFLTDPIENLLGVHRDLIAQALLRLRRDLADGTFLRQQLYTLDDSRFAGNTHHYWIRLGLDSASQTWLQDLESRKLPDRLVQWLKSQLNRKILLRLPQEYSTLVKVPFSVEIDSVADERDERIAWAIKHRLPATTPYSIFHSEINRLLKYIGHEIQPPNESEFDSLFAHYGNNAIAKSRNRFPEVWDELRGHYILDSRGSLFAKSLVTELKDRKLLLSSSKFVDIGSGIGTNVFAVNHYSKAHATGIEKHPGIMRMSHVLKRRLLRVRRLDATRLDFVLGDAFDSRAANLGQYDVFYVYSPIGKWVIDIDMIVDRAKVGSVMVLNRLPIRNRDMIEPLNNVAGLYAFRKVREKAGD